MYGHYTCYCCEEQQRCFQQQQVERHTFSVLDSLSLLPYPLQATLLHFDVLESYVHLRSGGVNAVRWVHPQLPACSEELSTPGGLVCIVICTIAAHSRLLWLQLFRLIGLLPLCDGGLHPLGLPGSLVLSLWSTRHACCRHSKMFLWCGCLLCYFVFRL